MSADLVRIDLVYKDTLISTIVDGVANIALIRSL